MSLQSQVAGLLTSDKIWEQPHFGLDGHVICGCDLRAVGAAVRDERIKVKKIPAGTAGPGAWYIPSGGGKDTLYVRFDPISTETQKALVIHEAVHAALDMNKAKGIIVRDSEGIAYVHQCFYLVPHAKEGERMMGEGANDKVWAAAWSIAKTLREGKEPTNDQISKLRAGVKVHKNYKDEWQDKFEADGIPD